MADVRDATPIHRDSPPADVFDGGVRGGEAVRQVPDFPIPVAGPWITDREVEAVADAARNAWYADAGTVVKAFEHEFAAACGRRHALALPSCTSGLHLALAGLGVGPGDEVIVPDSTWIATSAPISYVGATPVFVDVEPDTWCIAADALESAINDRTRAVIVVDLYGGMPEMDRVIELCDARGIAVIEDAAEAAGATFEGRPAGSFGVASTFSFHGSKTLTTHEGGMVLTDDDDLYTRMFTMHNHGQPPNTAGQFWNVEVAYKYKMSAMQAAMGRVQLERLDELVGRKRELFHWYQERLGAVEGVVLNDEPDGVHNVYWMSTVVLDERFGLTKRELADALAREGVSTRPFFSPLSALPAYHDMPGAADAHRRNEVAARLGEYGVNLPSALTLRQHDIDHVCDALLRILQPSS